MRETASSEQLEHVHFVTARALPASELARVAALLLAAHCTPAGETTVTIRCVSFTYTNIHKEISYSSVRQKLLRVPVILLLVAEGL
jgi:hypothetical protein